MAQPQKPHGGAGRDGEEVSVEQELSVLLGLCFRLKTGEKRNLYLSQVCSGSEEKWRITMRSLQDSGAFWRLFLQSTMVMLAVF